MLYELVYSSTPSQIDPNDAELDAILTQARSNNALSGITGMLVYHRNQYLQLIEGEESTVRHLFKAITMDMRHSSPHLYWEGPIPRRTFAGWHMDFARLDSVPAGRLPFQPAEGIEDLLMAGQCSVGRRFFEAVQAATIRGD